MEPDQLKWLLSTYGYENLVMIVLNNSKRIIITDENRDKIKFDHENQFIIQEEEGNILMDGMRYIPKTRIICNPYYTIETCVFDQKAE